MLIKSNACVRAIHVNDGLKPFPQERVFLWLYLNANGEVMFLAGFAWQIPHHATSLSAVVKVGSYESKFKTCNKIERWIEYTPLQTSPERSHKVCWHELVARALVPMQLYLLNKSQYELQARTSTGKKANYKSYKQYNKKSPCHNDRGFSGLLGFIAISAQK